jgi:hypothetical protein
MHLLMGVLQLSHFTAFQPVCQGPFDCLHCYSQEHQASRSALKTLQRPYDSSASRAHAILVMTGYVRETTRQHWRFLDESIGQQCRRHAMNESGSLVGMYKKFQVTASVRCTISSCLIHALPRRQGFHPDKMCVSVGHVMVATSSWLHTYSIY